MRYAGAVLNEHFRVRSSLPCIDHLEHQKVRDCFVGVKYDGDFVCPGLLSVTVKAH